MATGLRQVDTGKAFEYSIAKCYYDYLRMTGRSVELIENNPLITARNCYNLFSPEEKYRYDTAANNTIATLILIEPGLLAERSPDDVLQIRLATDAEGQNGDVRDIIFTRHTDPIWEIGFSAKNNHDAVKHSRLSPDIDFGDIWLGAKCSQNYFKKINRVFDRVDEMIKMNPNMLWADLGDSKENDYYFPILSAFREEMLYLNETNNDIPAKLLAYLIGRFPFYKVIKDDKNNLVIVKSYNLGGKLNKTVNGISPRAKTPKIDLPTRIIEFKLREASRTTLVMTLDKGWQISFRIHSASSRLERSLKFDITLIGNPPVLFTQHLFAVE